MYFVDFPGKTAGWAAVYSVLGLVLAMSAAVGLFNLLRAFFTRRIPRELLDEHIFSLQRLRRLLKFGQGKMVNEG
jgi:O-antigen/teichoic acid export membrane protein